MRFDPANSSKPTQSTVQTGTLAAPPQHNPQREGFRFDGWTYDGQPFDFQTPILQDTILKAQWTNVTDWTLSPDHGPASGARLTISPPSRQKPSYVSIQAAGDQFTGLTGDGRIYTWTQDSTPKQVPFPAQAPDGFHYLQAAADSLWQAALGSDQHIYTWTSGQSTPTILDTGRNTEFTSISLNDDRLLAVDRQGQVHAFQDSQKDTQSTNTKPEEQETTSLPGKAQAVTVASGSRILIVDADGQAWTWDTSNTGKAKPVRVKQDPGMRIIQAQALNQGILLLDADRQANYLADSTNSLTAVSLPDGVQIGRITANKDQAIITGKDGRLWAWKPGKAPKRADKEGQAYAQAASTGSRVTAISRQGNLYRWFLDGQGQPGRPARLDTTTAPTLESASMDNQALTLSRNNGSWQTDIPAHKPGQAAILIAGRQDGQPFTRSLKYTVNQTLTRDTEAKASYTVHFNTDGGSPEPEDQSVSYPYDRVKRPSPDPTRKGFLFDGWFIGEVAYDFSKPITRNLTLNAKWTSEDPDNTWKIDPSMGSQLGGQQTTITTPASRSGIKFNQVSGSENGSFSLAVGSDGNAYAWGDNSYGQLGNGTFATRTTLVMVQKPDRKTYPDVPANFTYVQVSAGGEHSLALGSDGYVYAWGDNSYGQLGNNKGGYNMRSNVPVRVHDPNSPSDPSKGLKAILLSAGWEHSLAIDTKGDTWAWGYNWSGQLANTTHNRTYKANPVPKQVLLNPKDASTKLKATQVSAGYLHSLAIDEEGNIWAWGDNWKGQLGNGTISDQNAPNPVPKQVLLNPNDASTGLKAVQVSAGYQHSLAIDEAGNTWAWGSNESGQLGNNTTSNQYSPKRVLASAQSTALVGPWLNAVQISANRDHSLAIDEAGNTWAWGSNSYGLLGNNTTSNQCTPVKVLASAQSTSTVGPWLKSIQISTGPYHSLAIDTDGNAYAWGWNSSGQLGNDSIPTGQYNSKAQSSVPVPVMLNLQPVITGVRFDSDVGTNLTRGDGNSVSVLTPAHQPGTVTVSVDYTLGGAPQTPDTSLRYTYLPAGVLPRAGGEGILLALAAGMTGMGGVLASRRHRQETRQLVHASHE